MVRFLKFNHIKLEQIRLGIGDHGLITKIKFKKDVIKNKLLTLTCFLWIAKNM